MGFTIDDALTETASQYKLKLLAGKEGCANAISWVHMIEDMTIIRQLWGKELAVSTGLGFQEDGALLEFVKKLVKYHSVGLIINTGMYIHEIPDDVIEYCDEHSLPLLTMPWEISMADLIRDYSIRCLDSQREDRHISKYFQNVFIDSRNIENARENLTPYFDVNGSFQVILINIENADSLDKVDRGKISSQIEICFEKIECTYSFFWFDGHFVLILNNLDTQKVEEIVNNMYKRSRKRNFNHVMHIGIGPNLIEFRNVIKSYKRAKASVQMAIQFHYPTIAFEEMGIYQLLFSIEDKDILESMYHKSLDPIIDYDKKHHGELEKTLYYYLEYGGNQQLMAKELFMHRNTINYRLNKIKELLETNLDTAEERIPYILAFYIKKMLIKG